MSPEQLAILLPRQGPISWACSYVWGYSGQADHERCTGRVHDKSGKGTPGWGPIRQAGGQMTRFDGGTVRCCCPTCNHETEIRR